MQNYVNTYRFLPGSLVGVDCLGDVAAFLFLLAFQLPHRPSVDTLPVQKEHFYGDTITGKQPELLSPLVAVLADRVLLRALLGQGKESPLLPLRRVPLEPRVHYELRELLPGDVLLEVLFDVLGVLLLVLEFLQEVLRKQIRNIK